MKYESRPLNRRSRRTVRAERHRQKRYRAARAHAHCPTQFLPEATCARKRAGFGRESSRRTLARTAAVSIKDAAARFRGGQRGSEGVLCSTAEAKVSAKRHTAGDDRDAVVNPCIMEVAGRSVRFVLQTGGGYPAGSAPSRESSLPETVQAEIKSPPRRDSMEANSE